jgi:hypothetical protein
MASKHETHGVGALLKHTPDAGGRIWSPGAVGLYSDPAFQAVPT